MLMYAGPMHPSVLHMTSTSSRHAGGCQIILGPGRRIVRRTAREGVSRFAGQAGTQAPDPTPVLSQDRGSRAGSTIHILPAESGGWRLCCLRGRPCTYAPVLGWAGGWENPGMPSVDVAGLVEALAARAHWPTHWPYGVVGV